MAFTQLFSDPFNESNGALDTVSPGNWSAYTNGSSYTAGAQIVSQTCTFALNDLGGGLKALENLIGATLPSDQWVSVKLAVWNAPVRPGMSLGVRSSETTPLSAGYEMDLIGNGSSGTVAFFLWENVHGSLIAHNSSLSVSAGDVFLLAARGTTVSVYQNGNQIASVTNSVDASGTAWFQVIPTNDNEQSSLGLTNFLAGDFGAVGPTATLGGSYYSPRPVQIFGVISSGPNAGEIAAVATDANGNLAISGGSGGSFNSIDVLGSIFEATPVMIFGAISGLTVPGSTLLFGCNCDNFGNLLCSIGTGGGNSYPSLDTPTANNVGVTPCQVFGRDPAGNIVGVPCSSAGALGDTINPITNVPTGYNGIDEVTTGEPIPVVLVARIATGYPNAGSLVMVSLDPNGRLCVAGSSGSSTTPSTILSVANGVPMPIQLYGRTAAGTLTSVPLTGAGSLLLN